ncbi:MAG: VWA domain-containing protein [Verrucomicrobiae bacterium]|nr:VWA domain-containing protein [Verrucomicrobiae bacterium]
MSITFAQPAALLLLFALPVLAVLKLWGNRRARMRACALVAPRLLGSLVTGRRPALSGALFALELAALACFVGALARPQYGFVEREIEGEGRSLMIAVDTSRSMLAEDLAPNRLQRAVMAAHELVLALPYDRIGVIAFAGRAFVQAPLTIDHAAVLETLSQLDTSIIPRGGTNVSEAITQAIETFDKVESANHALIIFTDGDELEGDALAAARLAFEKNVMIITIGVGTRAGGVIPDPGRGSGKGYITDAEGRLVRTQLHGDKLEQLARITRGLYLRLDTGEVAGALVKKALENLDKVTLTSQRLTREPIERYRWPLVTGVILLLTSWVGMLGMAGFRKRRGPDWNPAAALTVLLFAAALATPAEAGIFSEDPYKAMEAGRFDSAIESLTRKLTLSPKSRLANEWRFARGTAAFREGDFDLAIDDFGATLLSDDVQLQEQSHYNLANTIANKASLRTDQSELDALIGDIGDAIDHYDAALRLNSSNAAATANRDALEAYLEQLKKAWEQAASDGGEPQASEDGEGDSEGEGDNPGEGDPSSSSEGAGKGKEGKEPGDGEEGQGNGSSRGDQEDQQGGGDEGAEKPENGKGEGEEGGDDGGDSELEGELKAMKQGGDDGTKPEGEKGGDGRNRKDPKTGFSPSEARQLLHSLADEDRNVQPMYGEPVKETNYKDW